MSIDVSTSISVYCGSTYRSLCRSRAGQVSSNMLATLGHYSLSVDSQSIVGQYFAGGSLIDCRHITDNRDLMKLPQRRVDALVVTSVEWWSSISGLLVKSRPRLDRYLTATVCRLIVGSCFADGSPTDH